MKLYALRHIASQDLLGWYTTANEDAQFCVSTSFTISFGDIPWLVPLKDWAVQARLAPTKWYNASYETPDHNFKPEELEVVELNISSIDVIY